MFRGLGVALFCLALPALPARSGEPPEKAPEADQDVQGLVKKALEKEVAGDNRGREQLLHKALDASPDAPAANWQLGRLRVGHAWRPAADAGDEPQNGKRLAEYRGLLGQSKATVASQSSLAQWCKKNHFTDEARIHWQNVLKVDPDNADAIAALKLKPFNGSMLTAAQIRSAKKDAQDISKAVDGWRPLVARWSGAAGRGDGALPAAVREKIVKMSDPADFLGLEQVLVKQVADKHRQKEYHRMLLAMLPALGENPHLAAAASLARHILYVDFDDVALAAAAGLKQRPPDQYMTMLMGGLQSPLEVRIKPAASGIDVYQEGVTTDYSFSLTLPDSPSSQGSGAGSGGPTGRNPTAAQGPAGDIQRSIRRENAAIAKRNARVISALRQLTGLDLGERPMNWWKWWWQDYNELYTVSGGSGGYYGQSINTVIHRQVSVAEGEFVDHWGIWGGVHGNGGPFAGPGGVGASGVTGGPVATMGPIATGVYGITSAAWLSRGPRGAAVGGAYSIPVTHTSDHTSVKPGSSSACSGFAPATKVWALGGRKPIGEIKVGDRVLAQDVETGELAYKPVLAVPIRPLGPRVKLSVYRESIIAASSHPF